MSRRLEGRAAIGHLLRRGAFGASPALFARLPASADYEDVLRHLLDGLDTAPAATAPDFDPYVPGTIQQAWLDRMLSGIAPLAEKLALFWHGHFATSNAKVQDPLLLWRQYELFRSKGAEQLPGPRQGRESRRRDDRLARRQLEPQGTPERELRPRVAGALPAGNRELHRVGRPRGGARLHRMGFARAGVRLRGASSTTPGRRPSTDGVVHSTATTVIDLLASTRACHRFLAAKLLRFFSHPDPDASEIDALAGVWRETKGDVRAVLRAMFTAPSFLDATHARSRIQPPVDFVISALGAAGVTTSPGFVQPALDRMGQILFRPPSVKGWPEGDAWLGAAALIARFDTAVRIGETVSSDGAADEILDRLFDGAVPAVLDRTLRGRAPRDRVALALASPEAQLA